MLKAYAYYIITGLLFGAAIIGQFWTAAMLAHTPAEFWNAVFENWQSEFLQLIWQVAGLAIFYALGSSQSKHESKRQEAKIEWIMTKLSSEGHDAITEINERFDPRKE